MNTTLDQKVRLTKRVVDAAPIPAAGRFHVWDSEIRGFCVRVQPTGRKVYALKYRVGAQQRWYTIGTHGSPWTPEKARDAAQLALARVQIGEDPAGEKAEARRALTVAALIDTYLKDGPSTKPAKRASTWEADRSNLERHILPLVGSKVADAVTKADAARAVHDIAIGKTSKLIKTRPRGLARITGGEGTARRTRITTAAMFAWGIEHGLVKANPFAGVKLAAAPVQERFLDRDEAMSLLATLSKQEAAGKLSPTFADAVRLLLFTGSRKTEVLGLRWSEVDFARRLLVLPPDRTKAGGKTGERRIVLSAPALSILERRRGQAESETFVFPAASGASHAVGLRKPFQAACKAAGLAALRVHDLRHSFASFAIADGVSLFVVSKLLGHASTRTAERYTHVGADPLQEAAAGVGSRLMGPGGQISLTTSTEK